MAKSRNSCFKIIACGSDSAESDDFERTESTTSTDKRGWSFRKRSPRHRVLSNTVISEMSSAGLKDNQGATTSDSYAKTNSTVPAKSSASEAKDETVPSFPSAAVNMKIADTLPAHGNGNDSVCTVQESVAILIQSAIRGYLAKKALSKLKNVVKLQAAVRGHLVRRQAVGTLRCVHAIVKMQALVRARLSLERLNVQEKGGGEPKTEGQRVNSLENSVAEVNKTYTSTKMLLANGFARQLLESKPKTRPIYINCDPSRSDSAWKWLERWMSVTSSDNGQPEKHLNPDYQENGAETNPTAYEIGTEGHSGILSVPTALVSGVKEAEIVVEGEDNLNIDNADEFEFQACKPIASGKTSSSAVEDDMEDGFFGIPQETSTKTMKACKPTASGKTSSSAVEDDMEDGFFGIPQETSAKTMKACKPTASGKTSSSAVEDDMEDGFFGIPQETSTNTMKTIEETPGSFSNQVETQSSATKQELLGTDSDKTEINTENLTRAAKRVASEQIGSEGKKFIFGSRKSINPAFAAVQSKFEELSSAATSGRSISSSYPDATPESRLDSPSSWTGSVTKAKDVSMTEDSISHDPRIQMWGSECGTELSISSTLDSPDRHEAEGGEFANETRSSDKGGSDKFNLGNLDAYKDSVSHSGYVQPGKLQEVVENSSDSVSPLFPTKVETNPSEHAASDIHGQLDTVTDQPVESLSPEGSPRSPITAPDSHGTPSSQISLNSKKKKSDNLPSQKRRPQSSGKKTMPNQIHDSAVRNSSEHLPRDLRNGTKRNSFDHEPRNSSSNPLPSYMQATESAKAKAHVSHSPKSSPDVQEKDSYVKKRHSLPVTTGKQDSPRMQRSMSQAQQTTKGGATHSPQTATERRWQR